MTDRFSSSSRMRRPYRQLLRYQDTYFTAKDTDLAEVLGRPAELVVAAGGDGTVFLASWRTRAPIDRQALCMAGRIRGSPTWRVIGISIEPQPLQFRVLG